METWQYVSINDIDGTSVILPVNTAEEINVARAWIDGAGLEQARVWALPEEPDMSNAVELECCEGGAGNAILADTVDCGDAVKTSAIIVIY